MSHEEEDERESNQSMLRQLATRDFNAYQFAHCWGRPRLLQIILGSRHRRASDISILIDRPHPKSQPHSIHKLVTIQTLQWLETRSWYRYSLVMLLWVSFYIQKNLNSTTASSPRSGGDGGREVHWGYENGYCDGQVKKTKG